MFKKSTIRPSSHRDLVHHIKNVIFDLGGVILEWNPQKIVSSVFKDPAAQKSILEGIFMHKDWLEFDKGIMEYEDAITLFTERTGFPDTDIKELMKVYMKSLVPIKESIELLEYLYGVGLSLFCLSNINSKVYLYLRNRFDFWDRFQGIVISGHVKMIKPDIEIYRHLIATQGLNPQKSVFIDDNLENVKGAEHVGMKVIRFISPSDCRKKLDLFLKTNN